MRRKPKRVQGQVPLLLDTLCFPDFDTRRRHYDRATARLPHRKRSPDPATRDTPAQADPAPPPATRSTP